MGGRRQREVARAASRSTCPTCHVTESITGGATVSAPRVNSHTSHVAFVRPATVLLKRRSPTSGGNARKSWKYRAVAGALKAREDAQGDPRRHQGNGDVRDGALQRLRNAWEASMGGVLEANFKTA